MTLKAAKTLSGITVKKAMTKGALFRMEDVYFTGIMAKLLGVQVIDHDGFTVKLKVTSKYEIKRLLYDSVNIAHISMTEIELLQHYAPM